MSTPDPQHGHPQHDQAQHDQAQQDVAQPGGDQRPRMSTDMIVVLCVIGVLVVALLVGGIF